MAGIGQRVPGRARLLATMARSLDWTRGAELGVLEGATFLYILGHCPALTMIGVDRWENPTERPDAEGYRSYGGWDLEACAVRFLAAARRFGDRAVVHRLSTQAAARLVPAGSLDFVFIDADHTEAAVRADILTWAPKVRESGWMLGHDRDFPSVRRAIDDLLPGWREFRDRCWGTPKAETPFP